MSSWQLPFFAQNGSAVPAAVPSSPVKTKAGRRQPVSYVLGSMKRLTDSSPELKAYFDKITSLTRLINLSRNQLSSLKGLLSKLDSLPAQGNLLEILDLHDNYIREDKVVDELLHLLRNRSKFPYFRWLVLYNNQCVAPEENGGVLQKMFEIKDSALELMVWAQPSVVPLWYVWAHPLGIGYDKLCLLCKEGVDVFERIADNFIEYFGKDFASSGGQGLGFGKVLFEKLYGATNVDLQLHPVSKDLTHANNLCIQKRDRSSFQRILHFAATSDPPLLSENFCLELSYRYLSGASLPSKLNASLKWASYACSGKSSLNLRLLKVIRGLEEAVTLDTSALFEELGDDDEDDGVDEEDDKLVLSNEELNFTEDVVVKAFVDDDQDKWAEQLETFLRRRGDKDPNLVNVLLAIDIAFVEDPAKVRRAYQKALQWEVSYPDRSPYPLFKQIVEKYSKNL